MELELWQWMIALLAGLIIGVSKASIKGIGIISVTMLALVFGSKASTGILLPLLIVGDIFAVIYYSRYTEWKYLWRLLPWMIVGVLIGVVIGQDLPEIIFKQLMASVILLTLAMMIWWERKKDRAIPGNWYFGAVMGTLAGITTMIGNLAGAFSNLYFLAMRLPKNNFIGTAAWLFFIINIFKVPFHVLVWKTISWETILINLKIVPGLLAGLLLGVYIVEKIRDEQYRKLVIVLTGVGAVLIFFR